MLCLSSFGIQALEYEVQFDNELVNVAKITLDPYEEVGYHRDVNPRVIVVLQGGTITRVESTGEITDIALPTGYSIFREPDLPGEYHKNINNGPEPIQMVVIQLKDYGF